MRVLIVAGLAACYSPSAPTGAPCASDQSCPAPLQCYLPTGTCEVAGFAPPDASVPDADLSCWPRWRDGTVRLSDPRVIVEAQPRRPQHDPSLSGDELTLYFIRELGTSTLWRATRATRTDEFTDPAPLSLSASDDDFRLTAPPAIGDAIFGSARPGGVGDVDLWHVAPAGGSFGTPDQLGLSAVNSALAEYDPELSADGLDLYFAASDETGLSLFVARRTSLSDPFQGPSRLAIQSALPESFMADPTLSPDETVLVYSRDPVNEPRQIYYAVVVPGMEGFEERGLVPGIESIAANDPELSSDGCTLYFAFQNQIVASTVID